MSETELRDEVAAIWALTARLADKVEQLHIRLNPGGGKTDYELAKRWISTGRRDGEDDGGD